MTERVPSDHDAVTTHRTHVERVGRTARPRVSLPGVLDVTVGDVLRVSLAGETYHAQVRESLGGGRDLRGAFANARLARAEGEGENHLPQWLDSVGVGTDDPLLVDAVTPGFMYGLRPPGQRVVYAAQDPPSSSLADIARDIDG